MMKRFYSTEKIKTWFESISHLEKTYPEIDPFHRVYRFAEGVYSLYEENINGGGGMWLHLIDGPEKALLVDTGGGIGDLKALVTHLVGDKELYVVNTHEHWDHVMGNYQFEHVWCHTYAVPYITERFMKPDIWDRFLDESGRGLRADFGREDLIPYQTYALFPCEDGTIFDLGGGHLVEAVYTAGHAAGGLSFLDHHNRILFTGALHSENTVIAGTNKWYPEQNTVDAFLESLESLQRRHYGKFDRLFAGHAVAPMGKNYILQEMQACREVIADRSCYESVYTGKFGQVLYQHMAGEAGLQFTKEAFR